MDNLRVSRFTIVKSLQYLLILLLWFLLTSIAIKIYFGAHRKQKISSGRKRKSYQKRQKQKEGIRMVKTQS